MAWLSRLLIATASLAYVTFSNNSAIAGTFFGDLPVGYSSSLYQLGQSTSSVSIDISALGSRNMTLCGICNSAYNDSYTVDFFNQTGTLLESANETNYLWYNMYASSHGIGAGPVFIAAPGGAATMQIVSQLSITGLLGPNGSPLGFGDLSIVSDASITAATPIPSSLALLAPIVAMFGAFSLRKRSRIYLAH